MSSRLVDDYKKNRPSLSTEDTAKSGVLRFIVGGSEAFGVSSIVEKSYNPADQASVVGEFYQATADHVELIEKSAQDSYRQARKTTVLQRIEILNNLADLIEERQAIFIDLITREAGKPFRFSEVEVKRAAKVFRLYAERLQTDTTQTMFLNGREAEIRRFPHGPVLAITPFNFPLNLLVHKLAPAIAVGTCITIKPAPQTSVTALALGKLAIEAGYQGISVVPCTNEVAELLVKSPTFKKLSFTGSAEVGWYLKTMSNHKSVTLELGGNAAVVIDDLTLPVEALATQVAHGAYAYAGQICIATQRIFVNQLIYEPFLKALKQAVRDLKVGDPQDPKTIVGPLISIDAMNKTRATIKEAITDGANGLYGGNTYNMFTLNPLLLDRTTPQMKINSEQAFGPVATIQSYARFEEALSLVNDSKYGLQCGIYTNDETKIEQAFQQLDMGGVIINDIPGYRDDVLPYGGIKYSGCGKEGVMSGIEDMTYEKVLIKRNV